MNSSSEILGEINYKIIDAETYEEIPVGTFIKFDGIIDEKPILKNSPSKKPFRVQLARFYIETHFSVNGIKMKYEGPAFLRKGENITIWGKKQISYFDARQIETESFIITLD
ncbi:hypothetical protein E4H04_11970 [Candidatus Bathyarchaeota archaeon]|jgi:hypothetical protein|nr:MAG: hypothetical protein E4H04_11970 [Candidatus Bathyarchaeota archaeon]